ncbi:hypothetical protein [Pedobacter sp. UBA5917]|uniref:hypothetical protein n=1 Tax=Pedobacter sp. UBA5917 TaxID=1947061 RepID=UPI0025F4BD21|nr:hypothetical protein [Pedobacter sp. UBA5917]
MGKNATKKSCLGLLMIIGLISNANGQQVTDANVKRFCDGETVSYSDASATIPSGYTPRLYYSSTKISAPDDPATAVGATMASLTGTTINNPKTGYYYLKGVPTDASLCETPYQEIAIYIFKPLSIDFVAKNYCNTSTPAAQVATPTATDAYTTYGYQWYRLDGSGNEIKLTSPSASTKDYTPVTADGLVIGQNKLRVKVGYFIPGVGHYCVTSKDHDITINATPNSPGVTVTGAQAATL